MLRKIEVGPGWFRYKQPTPIKPGTYYLCEIRSPADKTKKQLGMIACEDDKGRFRWLAPFERWVKQVLIGSVLPETGCYGLPENLTEYPPEIVEKLYPWQRRFLSDAIHTITRGYDYRRGAIVSLGGGKTLVGLLLCTLGGRSAVLAPRYVHDTWRRDAEFWGLPMPMISTYESARKLGQVDVLICDEVLLCKSPDTNRSEYAKRLSESASVVVALTGTPISACGPLDWRWLSVVSPGSVPTNDVPWRYLFSDVTELKEVAPGRKAYVTPANGWNTEKISKFVSPYLMRVDTSELTAHLPPIRYMIMNTPKPKDWDIVVLGAATDRGPSKRVTQARMLSDGFILNDDGQPIWLHQDKIKAVVEFVQGLGEPVVIAAAWRETLFALEEALSDYKPAVMSGDTHDLGLQQRLFLEGDTDVLLINSRYSKGVNNLQDRCRVLVFVSWSPSPDDRKQMIGRLFRKGQSRGVQVVDIIADETMDSRMLELIRGHSDLSEEMVQRILAEEFLK